MIKTLIAVATLVAMHAGAQASPEIALDASGGTLYVRGSFANFGYSFTLTEARVLNSMGLWDRSGNGLADSHQVGLWASDGTLVAQATLDQTADAVASVGLDGVWRFADVADVLLPLGSYTIGAYYPSTADAFRGSAVGGLITAPWMTYGQGLVTVGAFGDQFGRPDTPTGAQFQPGFFGPNFQSSAVPLPGSLALVIAGLGLIRWRRAAAAARA